jgi:hypothetical protein
MLSKMFICIPKKLHFTISITFGALPKSLCCCVNSSVWFSQVLVQVWCAVWNEVEVRAETWSRENCKWVTEAIVPGLRSLNIFCSCQLTYLESVWDMPLLVTLNNSGMWEDSIVSALLFCPSIPKFWQKKTRLFSSFWFNFSWVREINKNTVALHCLKLVLPHPDL